MRKIENIGDGEVLETILVFSSEEERELYFREAEKQIGEYQKKSLADLYKAYMVNTVKVRYPRRSAGKQKTKEALQTLNSTYMDQVKRIHELYATALGKLRVSRETSLLESDLPDPLPV